MRKTRPVSFVFVVALLTAVSADYLAQQNPRIRVQAKIPIKAYPFDLQNVRLLNGPFRDAMLRDQQYLLSVNADRLLHNFWVNAGLPSSTKPLGGWEAPDVDLA